VAIAWLVTTNDNVAAIRLYGLAGYRLRERRIGAVDELRRTLKPSIPEFGVGGVRISDELEFERRVG
jgi:dihydroorotate dehydrogenase